MIYPSIREEISFVLYNNIPKGCAFDHEIYCGGFNQDVELTFFTLSKSFTVKIPRSTFFREHSDYRASDEEICGHIREALTDVLFEMTLLLEEGV